jgi:methionyl aminopeptidase
MVQLKTDTSIEAMRETGRVVAQLLTAVRQAAAVGTSLRELDEVAREVLREAGAGPPFLNYRPHFAPTPFPAVICASVNDAIVHGIPTDQRLRDGDPVSIDAGAVLDGWAGDSAISFTVGRARPADTRLVDTAFEALEAGIAAAAVGNRIGDIAHAIGTVCRRAGYGIPEGFGGHGVGRSMHEDPAVPNEGRPGRGMPLRHGMVLAIEPMLIGSGKDAYHGGRDG